MNRFTKFLAVFGLVAVGTVGSASAAVKFDINWAGTYSMPAGSPTPTGAFNPAGGGVGVNFMLGQRFSLGIDARYLSRGYTQSGSQTTTMIEGALSFNVELGRFVELGVGGYGNYFLTKTQNTSGQDFGALGKIGFMIPVGKAAILLGGEYHYALGQLTFTGGNNTPHEVVALAGIRFGGGK